MPDRMIPVLVAVAVVVLLAIIGMAVYMTLFAPQCSGVVIQGSHVTRFTCPPVVR